MFSTNALTALASFTSNMNGYGVDYAAYNASSDPEKKVEDFIRGNRSGYANAEYDALIAAAAAKTDLKERAALLHQAEQMLLRDMPVIPLVFNQNFYVANSRMLKRLEVNYYGFTLFTRAKLKNYEDYFFLT